ncbi:MAG: RNA recognition motif-containing protein [Cellvibrionaceae bacterium]|jgi:RNA recognition motif-containing protein
MKIFAGNLPFNASVNDLEKVFGEFGAVAEVDLIVDRHSGQSKGFAFVQMSNNSESDKAIKGLNGSVFMDRVIKVNQVQPKKSDKSKKRRRY